jgi:hypothetical protein
MTGAVLFVATFTAQGWMYPGYSWTGMFVSELSLGPHGWVQILNFVLTGALVLVFGHGLRAHFSTGAASRAGPVLVQCMGVSLMVSGPFTTDPSALTGQPTAHGLVHGIFGAVFFTAAPLCCFVYFRRFRRDPAWRPLAGWTLAAGALLTLGIGMLKISQQPGTELFDWKGLVQRVLLVTLMSWIFAVAFRLSTASSHHGRSGMSVQQRYSSEVLTLSDADLESLRKRAARGDLGAVGQLIELAAEREDFEELRSLADGGSRDAADQLVELATEKSDLDELRRLAANGNSDAADILAELTDEGSANDE